MAGQYPDIPYDGPPAAYNSVSYGKRYVAIHDTSNTASAEGEAGYARRRVDGTSSHYYVDADSIVQSLHTDYGANHAGSQIGNRHAVSYEITGVNAWTGAQWLERVAWPLLARQIARDCRRHGIAAQLLTVAQMRDGRTTGLVTHDLMRQAWGGTTHTDPGPGFPLDHLLALVRAELTDTSTKRKGDDMLMLAVDQAGQHWLCDGMRRRPIAADEVKHLRYLGATGAISLWTGTPAEASASIWQGVSDLMGLPVAAVPTVDVEALATAIVAKLPIGQVPPTVEAIAEAVADELADRMAG